MCACVRHVDELLSRLLVERSCVALRPPLTDFVQWLHLLGPSAPLHAAAVRATVASLN
jgi:hypothetical protein